MEPRAISLYADWLFVGIDISKATFDVAFLTLRLLMSLSSYKRCPTGKFTQSRAGFTELLKKMQTYAPIERCVVLFESTGHYQEPLKQFLLDAGVTTYRIHPANKKKGRVKTDKRDALDLANHLYSILVRGMEFTDPQDRVYLVSNSPTITQSLRPKITHLHELVVERVRRKNKLNAICEETFPELSEQFKDLNGKGVLSLREKFPTPEAIAAATFDELCSVRVWRTPSNKTLLAVQELARQSIGNKQPERLQSLVVIQDQLINELKLINKHIEELESAIKMAVIDCREVQVIRSLPDIGILEAAAMVAIMGTVSNFETAAHLKSYFGFAVEIQQTGKTRYRVRLTRGGNRIMRKLFFLIVNRLTQKKKTNEWAKLCRRLEQTKCRVYKGKIRGRKKVLIRICTQLIEVIYALLKQDQELVQRTPPGQPLPPPVRYDLSIHQRDRAGQYRPIRKRRRPPAE